ncbi:MAG: type 1 glutamine amidotransferase domain-containing protein [Wenzhouxiangella sp.]
MKILMILTSHAELGDTGHKTGFWLEEFAAPYYVFKDAGADITLASPAGGQPPIDPNSENDDAQTDDTRRFANDSDARAALAATHKLADVSIDDFDAVFYPGGHGPLYDLYDDADSLALIRNAAAHGKILSAVCHAPAVFLKAETAQGEPLLKGRKVTAFSNSEEQAVGLADTVPYLLEDELQKQGASYHRADDWASHVVVDGRMITGQNPASSAATAEAVIAALKG